MRVLPNAHRLQILAEPQIKARLAQFRVGDAQPARVVLRFRGVQDGIVKVVRAVFQSPRQAQPLVLGKVRGQWQEPEQERIRFDKDRRFFQVIKTLRVLSRRDAK